MAPHQGRSALRTWLLPFGLLLGAASVVITLIVLVDTSSSGRVSDVLNLMLRPDPEAAAGALSNAAEVVAAVLAIAITVVAIVVELAANRYTHRITELFVNEPRNFLVIGFFVVTAVVCLFVNLTFDPGEHDGYIPYFGIQVSMAMLAVCLLILLPYFAFVFEFLNPINVVRRIRMRASEEVQKLSVDGNVTRRRPMVVAGIEQITDIAINATEKKEKGVSMAAVNALEQLMLDHGTAQNDLPDHWYVIDEEMARNPDFVSMSAQVREDIERRRLWFELKVLRQYQTIYAGSLNRSRDISYLIAINTRRIGGAALAAGRIDVVELVIKFFNTYLRATVNAKDLRTAYNVLNQYRLLGEDLLSHDDGSLSVEIAGYFKYYGHLAFRARLPFILETAAYDLAHLIEVAYGQGSKAVSPLLDVLLEVDQESEGEVQESSLRGVRKAQTKLGTHFLACGETEFARRVQKDMVAESTERLASIRQELLEVESGDFWEVSDRGVNFDYLRPEQKAQLHQFFSFFDIDGEQTGKLPTQRAVPPGA